MSSTQKLVVSASAAPQTKEAAVATPPVKTKSWYLVTEDELGPTASVAPTFKEDKGDPRAGASSSAAPELTPPEKKKGVLVKTPVLSQRMGHVAKFMAGGGKGKNAKLGIGKAGRKPRVLSLPLVYNQVCATTTGGVLNFSFGSTNLTGLTEFSDLANMFELVRVTGIRLYYEPFVRGAGLDDAATGHRVYHRPVIMVLDPDITVGTINSFTTLIGTTVPSDPNVKFTNTSDPVRKTFKAPAAERPLQVVSGDLAMGMWDWQGPASMATSIGALSWAAATDAQAGTNGTMGWFMVEYLTEWTFRQ